MKNKIAHFVHSVLIMGLIVMLWQTKTENDSPQVIGAHFVGKTRDVKVRYSDGRDDVLHGKDADQFIFNGKLPNKE